MFNLTFFIVQSIFPLMIVFIMNLNPQQVLKRKINFTTDILLPCTLICEHLLGVVFNQ